LDVTDHMENRATIAVFGGEDIKGYVTHHCETHKTRSRGKDVEPAITQS
jgi:hypothetical protein